MKRYQTLIGFLALCVVVGFFLVQHNRKPVVFTSVMRKALASVKVKIGKYKHYKGKMYEVVGIAHHSETLEPLVVYKALYYSPEFGEDALWVRPKAMFAEPVEIKGKIIPRFKYVKEY